MGARGAKDRVPIEKFPYERVSNILREAVMNLENTNRAKIVLLVTEGTQKRGELLKRNGGVEEGRTPDLCIANAESCISGFA